MIPNPLKGVHLAVKEAYDAGLSVVPPREDGTKAPESYWKQFQEERASIEILRDAYRNGRTGLGLVCGAVSGQLECMDFDSPEMYGKFRQACGDAGLDELLERIEAGYSEFTPHGFHLLYRTVRAGGCRKLARTEKFETLIEVKAEGGYIIVSPTFGDVNRDGPYVRASGSAATIPFVTMEDRDALGQVASTFDATPKVDGLPFCGPMGEGTGDRPGDDFIRRGSWDFLIEAGWTKVADGSDPEGRPQEFWRRPGKDRGNSAILHPVSGLFYVFSSSTAFPVIPAAYNKFRTLAFTMFDGDFKAATAYVKSLGYKAREKEPAPPSPPDMSGRLTLSAPEIHAFEIPEVSTLPMLGRDGLIMAGGTNLLYSYPKLGKTELLTAIVSAWAGSGLRIFYLTEEPFGNWKRRLGVHGCFSENLRMHYAWGYSVGQALELMAAETYDVLVVDTLRYTVGYQEGEGDKDVVRVLIPLFKGTEGKTVICSYHARKMPGEGGRDISGHHSLYGAFDRALRLAPVDNQDSHRRLTVSGRCMYEGDFTLTYKQDSPGHFRSLDAEMMLDQAMREPRKFDLRCISDGCGNSFQSARRDAKFCSDTCRQRERRNAKREEGDDRDDRDA